MAEGGNRGSAHEKICDALLELMETERFDEVSVTELVQRAGVSRSSFYRCFDSVYEVLQDIEDAYVEAFPSELRATSVVSEQLHAGAGAGTGEKEYAQLIAQNFRRYRLLTGPNGDASFKARMKNRLTRIMRQALEPALGSGPKTEVAVSMLAGTRMYAMDWWAAHAAEVDAVAYSDYVSKLTVAAMNAMVDAARTSSVNVRAK